MKKVLKSILALSLACLMLLGLVSCDKSGSIKKAFENKDYTVKTVNASDESVQSLLKILLNEEQMKKVGDYELILCTPSGLLNAANAALIIKFPGSSDLKDFLTTEKDGKKDTSSYDKAEKEGWINGNCLILTLGSDAKDIFKKA